MCGQPGLSRRCFLCSARKGCGGGLRKTAFDGPSVETGGGKRAPAPLRSRRLPAVEGHLLTLAAAAVKIISGVFFITLNHA